MIFILYICLHKKRQNASCSFECENRVSTEKRQEMGEGRSESGQWRLLVINVPKRLMVQGASVSEFAKGLRADIRRFCHVRGDVPHGRFDVGMPQQFLQRP